MSYLKAKELIKANRLMEEVRFEEALQKINKFEEKGDLSSHDQISCDVLKCFINIAILRPIESLKFAEKAFVMSQEVNLEDSIQLFDIFIVMAVFLIWNYKIDEGFDFIKKGEALLKKLTQESPQELKKRKALIAWVKGYLFNVKGDFEKALKCARDALTMRKELGLKIDYYLSLNQIGFICLNKGDFNRSLKYMKQTLEFAEKLNYKQLIMSSNFIIGTIYSIQGKVNRALECLNLSLSIAKKENNRLMIASSLNNIGMIYQMQGGFDEAMEYMENSLIIFEELGSQQVDATLDSLFHLALDKKDVELAQQYLERLKQANDQKQDILNNITYRVDKAVFLKTSSRTINRGKAEEILKQVIEEIGNKEGLDEYMMGIIALLNLCDLLLAELRNTADMEVIEELQKYIALLVKKAENHNSYSLLAETYLLKARLASITFNLKDARRFLTQAQQIAERHGLNQLVRKISSEQTNNFIKQLDKWEKLKESDISLKERIELANIDAQVDRILRNRVLLTRVTEEEVVVHKERKVCLVCRGKIRGHIYVCNCDAIYCENCSRALTDLENACWVCNAAIDASKPTKPYKEIQKEIKPATDEENTSEKVKNSKN